MHSLNQNLSKSTSMSLVDNVDFKIEKDNNEYLVLVKKQTQKEFSTIYLYDFEGIFFLKKIDMDFLINLKSELHINTQMQKFIICFMKSLKNSCSITISEEVAKLNFKLQLGQGLTMECSINLQTKLANENNEKGYKIILKLFLRQLYESKIFQQKTLKQQIQLLKNKKQVDSQNNEHLGKVDKSLQQFLDIQIKKAPINTFKNRDLLNPNRYKRKHAGVKYSTTNEK